MRKVLYGVLLLALIGCQPPDTRPLGFETDAKKGNEKSNEPNPVVLIDTSEGPIKVELFVNQAPITVKNFLGYVDDKFYDGTIFHRVIEGFMIQGGGMEPGLKEKKTKAPIKNESSNGISNVRGTIAMARTGDPNSATSQFYINHGDNGESLDKSPRNPGGYCVFGKVIDGMKVVDKIAGVRTKVVNPGQFNEMKDVPAQDVTIKSIRRVDKEKKKEKDQDK